MKVNLEKWHPVMCRKPFPYQTLWSFLNWTAVKLCIFCYWLENKSNVAKTYSLLLNNGVQESWQGIGVITVCWQISELVNGNSLIEQKSTLGSFFTPELLLQCLCPRSLLQIVQTLFFHVALPQISILGLVIEMKKSHLHLKSVII